MVYFNDLKDLKKLESALIEQKQRQQLMNLVDKPNNLEEINEENKNNDEATNKKMKK